MWAIVTMLLWGPLPVEEPPRPVPNVVQIKVHLIHLFNISEKDQTFEALFYMWTSWPATDEPPRIELVNAVDFKVHLTEISRQNGRHIKIQKVLGTFFIDFDLKNFPLDRQRLFIEFEDFARDARSLVLTGDGDQPTVNGDMGLADWRLTHQAYRQEENLVGGDPERCFSRLVCVLDLERRVSFYATRFFLPLLLLVCCSFTALFLDLECVETMVQIGITGMLSIIALALSMNDYLPRVSYVVLIDRIFIICYCIVFGVVALAVRCRHLVHQGAADKAVVLRNRVRLVFIPMMVLSLFASMW